MVVAEPFLAEVVGCDALVAQKIAREPEKSLLVLVVGHRQLQLSRLSSAEAGLDT